MRKIDYKDTYDTGGAGLRYVLKRLTTLPIVLLGVLTVVFLLIRLIPGDPARIAAGQRARPEQVEQVRKEFGLDKPVPVQYVRYIGRVIQGDLGTSLRTRQPVIEDIKIYFPASIELALAGVLLTVFLGVPIGVISAVKSGTWGDHISRVMALIGSSFPIFWLGLAMQLIFYQHLNWLPATGRLDPGVLAPERITGLYTIDSLLTGQFGTFVNALSHLLLPALTLSLGSMAIVSRITRSNMLEVLDQDYIRTARAKGLAEKIVHFGHALKNAMIPVLTVIGLQTGSLLGGTFLVETIFDWPGMGLYTVQSITTLDYYAIMGVSILVALIYVLTNLVVDQIYALIDPRIRY